MSTPGFSVDTDEVAARVEMLATIAGRLREAATAGRPLGPAAYGVVGRTFADDAINAAAAAGRAVDEMAAAAEAYRAGLRATLAEIRATEERIAATFGGPR